MPTDATDGRQGASMMSVVFSRSSTKKITGITNPVSSQATIGVSQTVQSPFVVSLSRCAIATSMRCFGGKSRRA